MKKLFILATAAVALASCSDSDLVGNIASSQQTEQPQAVEFGTYMGTAATRAGSTGTITTPILKNATYGFGVMGYQTAADIEDPITSLPNFMFNEKVTWNVAGYWTYSPVKYWPNGTTETDKKIDEANAANSPSNTATSTNTDRLSFFAYAPWVDVASSDYTSSKIGTLKFGADATGKSAFYANGCSSELITNGIAAITANTLGADPQVYYYMPTATTAAAVDLLWGLRGSFQYQETDAANNPDPALTNLGSSYNKNLTKQDVPETVNFLFKHALAKIGGNTSSKTATSGNQQCGLYVVLDVDGNGNGSNGIDNQSQYLGSNFDATKTLVTIESVSIEDGASANDKTTTTTTSNLKNSGWFDIATGTWSNVGIVDNKGVTTTDGSTYNIDATYNSGDYKLNPAIAENASISNTTGVAWQTTNSSAQGYTGGATGVVPTEAKPVYADTKTVSESEVANDIPALLMIPSGDTEQTLYVTVTYKVRTADSKLSTGHTVVTQTVTNAVSLKGLDTNKYYKLVMHLGLTSVKFSAIVADWAASDNATYNEGGTTDGNAPAEEVVWLPSNVVAQTTTTAAAPGTASNVNTAASNTSYTITLNNLVEGQKITATESADNITAVKIGSNDITSEYTLTSGDLTTGTATITVTLNPNTKVKAVSNLLTITQKDASDNVLTTTTVNIVQSAFDVVLAEQTAGNVVSTKDGDGNNINTSTGYTVTVVNSEGVTVSDGITKANGTITITPAGVYTVTVEYNDGTNPAISRSIDIHN